MDEAGRPGPKPKRLYLRIARFGPDGRDERPARRVVTAYLQGLDRVGRLVAHGSTTGDEGDLLMIRAADLPEAERVLRRDPYAGRDGVRYELLAWAPTTVGAGVNLDLPPARGSGRLTLLQRVTVVVRDQRQALAWYQDVLGLNLRVDSPETGYVELALGKGSAALSLVEPRREWGERYYSEARARVGATTGIAFQTDSVLALEQRLLRGGARITEHPRPQPWGGIALRFRDPDGNEFLAYEPASNRARVRRPAEPDAAAPPPGRAPPGKKRI